MTNQRIEENTLRIIEGTEQLRVQLRAEKIQQLRAEKIQQLRALAYALPNSQCNAVLTAIRTHIEDNQLYPNYNVRGEAK